MAPFRLLPSLYTYQVLIRPWPDVLLLLDFLLFEPLGGCTEVSSVPFGKLLLNLVPEGVLQVVFSRARVNHVFLLAETGFRWVKWNMLSWIIHLFLKVRLWLVLPGSDVRQCVLHAFKPLAQAPKELESGRLCLDLKGGSVRLVMVRTRPWSCVLYVLRIISRRLRCWLIPLDPPLSGFPLLLPCPFLAWERLEPEPLQCSLGSGCEVARGLEFVQRHVFYRGLIGSRTNHFPGAFLLGGHSLDLRAMPGCASSVFLGELAADLVLAGTDFVFLDTEVDFVRVFIQYKVLLYGWLTAVMRNKLLWFSVYPYECICEGIDGIDLYLDIFIRSFTIFLLFYCYVYVIVTKYQYSKITPLDLIFFPVTPENVLQNVFLIRLGLL